MKKTIFSFLISFTFLSTFIFAQDSNFTQQEIESLFIQDSQPLELIALSDEEMKTTEGAWLPFVSIMGGAIGSGIGNIAYQLSIRRSWSWSSFGWAVAKGAVMAPIGGYAWKAGVRAYRTFRRLPPAVVKPTPPIRQSSNCWHYTRSYYFWWNYGV